MKRSIRRALTVVAAVTSLGFTGLTAFASAAQPIVPKANIITIPAPDQVDHVYRADQCPWLRLFMASSPPSTRWSATDMSQVASRASRAVRALTAATVGAVAIVVFVASAARADPGPDPAPPVVVTTPGTAPSPVTPGIYGPLVGGGTMAPPPQPMGTDTPPESDPGFFDIPGQIEKAINNWFGNLVKSALGPVLKQVGRG